MLNQMVKWTVIIGLWRKYKQHISATLFLLLGLLLITLFHQDFVEYNEQSQTPYLALSYLVKWLAYLSCGVLYVVVLKRINKTAKFDSTLHNMMNNKASNTTKADKTEEEVENSANTSNTDPFAHLRSKKSLRSKADFIIESDENKKQ